MNFPSVYNLLILSFVLCPLVSLLCFSPSQSLYCRHPIHLPACDLAVSLLRSLYSLCLHSSHNWSPLSCGSITTKLRAEEWSQHSHPHHLCAGSHTAKATVILHQHWALAGSGGGWPPFYDLPVLCFLSLLIRQAHEFLCLTHSQWSFRGSSLWMPLVL